MLVCCSRRDHKQYFVEAFEIKEERKIDLLFQFIIINERK